MERNGTFSIANLRSSKLLSRYNLLGAGTRFFDIEWTSLVPLWPNGGVLGWISGGSSPELVWKPRSRLRLQARLVSSVATGANRECSPKAEGPTWILGAGTSDDVSAFVRARRRGGGRHERDYSQLPQEIAEGGDLGEEVVGLHLSRLQGPPFMVRKS